jgi:hypothetical protein
MADEPQVVPFAGLFGTKVSREWNARVPHRIEIQHYGRK